MKIKITHILGSIIAIIGTILLGSGMFEYDIKVPFFAQEGNFALGFFLIVVGLIIAFKMSEEKEDYY